MNDEFDLALEAWLRDLDGIAHLRDNHNPGLLFEGMGSSGRFLPSELSLDLQGSSDVEHHVVHLHEIYHKALNEGTAFGTALYVAHKFPAWAKLFNDLQDSARRTHETFATFMSVSLAANHYPNALDVLPVNGLYRRYYDSAADLVSTIETTVRKEIIVTAAARVAMQTPILDLLVDSELGNFELAAVRSRDLPDHRFAWIKKIAPTEIENMSRAADLHTLSTFGERAGGSHPLDVGVEDDSLDEVWDVWHEYVFSRLSSKLSKQGSSVVGVYDHHPAATKITRQLLDAGIENVHVQSASSPAPTDADESAAMLSMTSYRLRPTLWPARHFRFQHDVFIAELIEALTLRTNINGIPELVIHARTAGRLSDGYEWDARSKAVIDAQSNTPVVCVKVHTDADEGAERLEVAHVVIDDAQQARSLLEEWGKRGPSAMCIAASCFADPSFAANWVEPLRTVVPLVVLLDVPIKAVAGSENSLLPNNRDIRVDDYHRFTGLPHKALVWQVDGQPHVGLYVGDSLSTQLIFSQIEESNSNGTTTKGNDDWTEWKTVLASVIRSVTSCESYLDLRAFETWRRN